MKIHVQFLCIGCLLVSLAVLPQDQAVAQYTAVFTDEFAVSSTTMNLNLETSTRQTGSLAPINYVAITADVTNDYHHQLFDVATAPGQPLQLAGDGNPNIGPPVFAYTTMISPDYNFKGSTPAGIVGKRISFDLDLGATFVGASTYLTGGITIGGHRTLIDSANQQVPYGGTDGPFFSMNLVETTCCAPSAGDPPVPVPNFLQFWDGPDLVGNVIPNPAGLGTAGIVIEVNDPIDGDPWDGVGSTDITVSINTVPVFTYSKPDGGYSDNFITIFADRNYAGNGLATALVDNLNVFAAPAFPPSTPGDFDGDDDVDGRDFLLWQRGESPSPLSADDLSDWQAGYNGGLLSAVSVPEPNGLLIASLSLLGLVMSGRHWSMA